MTKYSDHIQVTTTVGIVNPTIYANTINSIDLTDFDALTIDIECISTGAYGTYGIYIFPEGSNAICIYYTYGGGGLTRTKRKFDIAKYKGNCSVAVAAVSGATSQKSIVNIYSVLLS